MNYDTVCRDFSNLPDSFLLTSEQTAIILSVAPTTLEVWRSTGRYDLPYTKIGRKVRYQVRHIKSFLESRTRTHTGRGV